MTDTESVADSSEDALKASVDKSKKTINGHSHSKKEDMKMENGEESVCKSPQVNGDIGDKNATDSDCDNKVTSSSNDEVEKSIEKVHSPKGKNVGNSDLGSAVKNENKNSEVDGECRPNDEKNLESENEDKDLESAHETGDKDKSDISNKTKPSENSNASEKSDIAKISGPSGDDAKTSGPSGDDAKTSGPSGDDTEGDTSECVMEIDENDTSTSTEKESNESEKDKASTEASCKEKPENSSNIDDTNDKELLGDSATKDKDSKADEDVSVVDKDKNATPSKAKSKKNEPKIDLPKRVTRSASGVSKAVRYTDDRVLSDDDDEIKITKEVKKDEESDIEMIEESDPLAFSDADVKKAKEANKETKKDSNVIIIDTNTLLKQQGNFTTVHPTAKTMKLPTVSASAQTASASVNTQASQIQNAIQAITGGNPAIQGLQSAYLSAIQQVLLAQGSNASNPHYLSQLQQYYNTLGALQDDAYVIEAPSFIVPYVMEGKPTESITAFLDKINKELEEYEKQKEEELKAEQENEEKKKREKEKREKEEKEREKEEKEREKEEKEKEKKKEEEDKMERTEKKEKAEDKNEDKEEMTDEEVKKTEIEEKKKSESKDEEEKDKALKKEKKQDDESEEEKKDDESEEKKEDGDSEDSKERNDREKEQNKSAEGTPAEETKTAVEEKKIEEESKIKDKTKTKDADDDKENKVKGSEKKEEEVIDLDKEEEEQKEEDLSHLGRWESYYKSALGKFFLDLGLSQAQEFIQSDLLKMQKRKLDKMKTGPTRQDVISVKLLECQLGVTRKRNAHLSVPLKICKFCSFKTECELMMERHLESPHMVNYTYRCNFCDFETRGPQVILFHTEAEHNVRGRLERAPAFFQCPLCPYEDNNKSKMTRHSFSCAKKFKADKNCDLAEWEPPAKIPKIQRGRPNSYNKSFESLKMPNILPKSLGGLGLNIQNAITSGLIQAASPNVANVMNSMAGRGRGRPVGSYKNITQTIGGRNSNSSLLYQSRTSGGIIPQIPGVSSAQQLSIANQVLQSVAQGANRIPRILPASSTNSLIPGLAASSSITIQSVQNKSGNSKSPQQPSISITPLPRGGAQSPGSKASNSNSTQRPAFVICEICDGYIKDLEQLRNHMNLIHKVKIHPKMIYNRPPLNCQKCQHRFFTDQGLERHLLGTHGLVTSSMQEAANKGKDAGRCPICGKVFQWKLLNHVSRDHKMTLKPAHLSYKCTVCTATFNMYRLFENHVYSAHSVVNKNKNSEASSSSTSTSAIKKTGDAPLKINDEITIIPQPAAKSSSSTTKVDGKSSPKKSDTPTVSKEITITKVGSRSTRRSTSGGGGVEVISLDDSPQKRQIEEAPKKKGRETATSKRARTST